MELHCGNSAQSACEMKNGAPSFRSQGGGGGEDKQQEEERNSTRRIRPQGLPFLHPAPQQAQCPQPYGVAA